MTWSTDAQWKTTVDGAVPLPPKQDRSAHDQCRFRWYADVNAAATDAGIPYELLQGIVMAESAGNPNAVSLQGAMGLAQVMPDNFAAGTTRAQMFDPTVNLRTSATILKGIIAKNGRDVPKIASVYNAGGGTTNTPHAAANAWGMREDRGYINRVVRAVNYLVASADDFMRGDAAGGVSSGSGVALAAFLAFAWWASK